MVRILKKDSSLWKKDLPTKKGTFLEVQRKYKAKKDCFENLKLFLLLVDLPQEVKEGDF